MARPIKRWINRAKEGIRENWHGYKVTKKPPEASSEIRAGYRSKPRRSARIVPLALAFATISGAGFLAAYHGGRTGFSAYERSQANKLVQELYQPGISKAKERELSAKADRLYKKIANREALLAKHKRIIEPILVGGGILAGILVAGKQRRIQRPVKQNRNSIDRYDEDIVVSDAQINSSLFDEKFKEYAHGNNPVKTMQEIVESLREHGASNKYLQQAIREGRRFVYVVKVKDRESKYGLVFTNNPNGLYFIRDSKK